jgi:hypothetical protein
MLAQSENQSGVSLFNASRGDVGSHFVGHVHWLLKVEIGYVLRTRLLWRKAEMLPEGASEGFMRTITGIERYRQDIWSTVHQSFGGLAQSPTTYVECNPATCTGAKCT